MHAHDMLVHEQAQSGPSRSTWNQVEVKRDCFSIWSQNTLLPEECKSCGPHGKEHWRTSLQRDLQLKPKYRYISTAAIAAQSIGRGFNRISLNQARLVWLVTPASRSEYKPALQTCASPLCEPIVDHTFIACLVGDAFSV